MGHIPLHQLAYRSLLELATEEGINASSRNEVYGCVFGRDSAITILKILRAHQHKPAPALLRVCRRALLTIVRYQGKEVNIESGEQPGKFIHELRHSKYDHLTNSDKPWFVYPDGILRNYDSIDSTPLSLIAIYRYWQTTQDGEFLATVLPAVEMGLLWIMTYADPDQDGLLEYDFPSTRKSGGLLVQSWTDSGEALHDPFGDMPKYPIAPIEAQAFAWLALKLWSDFYFQNSSKFVETLKNRAEEIKKIFNKKFLLRDHNFYFGAQALDGDKKQIKTITANPMLCLWAAYRENGRAESILSDNKIHNFVKRAFLPDLFVADAGIRTMSSLSPTYNPNKDSYHNGSFWPILNGLVVEGLENFGFLKEAQRLRKASLIPVEYFGCPIELYIKNGDKYLEYCSPTGQVSCRQQAWSAAAILDMTSEKNDITNLG